MISLLKYGLAGYGAYMLYKQYISKEIACSGTKQPQ
tara:strand:+ start:304 stop:411 length:108 start_codon:yes stop_codon:yes gene_type:complete